jgi:hypothetical protein
MTSTGLMIEVAAATPQTTHAGLIEQSQERLGRPSRIVTLDRIDINNGCLSRGIDRRQQVFRRGKQYALLHQAGGITDSGAIAGARSIRKLSRSVRRNTIRIGGAGFRRRWPKPCMESHAFARNGVLRVVWNMGTMNRVAPSGQPRRCQIVLFQWVTLNNAAAVLAW